MRLCCLTIIVITISITFWKADSLFVCVSMSLRIFGYSQLIKFRLFAARLFAKIRIFDYSLLFANLRIFDYKMARQYNVSTLEDASLRISRCIKLSPLVRERRGNRVREIEIDR